MFIVIISYIYYLSNYLLHLLIFYIHLFSWIKYNNRASMDTLRCFLVDTLKLLWQGKVRKLKFILKIKKQNVLNYFVYFFIHRVSFSRCRWFLGVCQSNTNEINGGRWTWQYINVLCSFNFNHCYVLRSPSACAKNWIRPILHYTLSRAESNYFGANWRRRIGSIFFIDIAIFFD